MTRLFALLLSLAAGCTYAASADINGELQELPGIPIVDAVSFPVLVDAPDAVAATLWDAYKDNVSGVTLENKQLTNRAIPTRLASSRRVIPERRRLLRTAPQLLLPIGTISAAKDSYGVALYQDKDPSKYRVSGTSTLVCTDKLVGNRIFCVRLMNFGSQTGPVNGIKIPTDELARTGASYSQTDRLFGAVIIQRTKDKAYEENGAQIVNATATKYLVFDAERGSVITKNIGGLDVIQPNSRRPSHWVAAN
jgi:hypothetical protein